MSNIILNNLMASKKVLNSIELIPHPNHGLGGHLAVFGIDHYGNQTGWWISQDSDDRRDDPDNPQLIGESVNEPSLEQVETLSRNHPDETIVVEWWDANDWGPNGTEIHHYEFLNGEVIKDVLTQYVPPTGDEEAAEEAAEGAIEKFAADNTFQAIITFDEGEQQFENIKFGSMPSEAEFISAVMSSVPGDRIGQLRKISLCQYSDSGDYAPWITTGKYYFGTPASNDTGLQWEGGAA